MIRKAHGALAIAALTLMFTAACGGGGGDGSGASNRAPAAPAGTPFAPDIGPGQPDAPADTTTGGPGAGTGETSTDQRPLSTFALDVDTASYTFARAQIAAGRRPARDRIRPEEFVNAFRQDYPEPPGSGFTITAGGARLPESHRSGGDGG